MRKLIKIYVLILMFFILISNVSFAKTGEINSADYTIFVKDNGTVEITEIIDLSLEENVDVFVKNFDKDIIITNLKVKEYNKEGTVKLEYENVDDVSKLDVNTYSFIENTLNIKINLNVRKYLSIAYTVENAIDYYRDCAEIDIILQDSDFDFSSSEITGKVKFEDANVNLNDVYVWGHSENKVNVKLVEELNQIKFDLVSKNENQKFDIKVVFTDGLDKVNPELVNNEKRLEQIINIEKDIEENKKKLEEKNNLYFMIIMIIVIVIFVLAIVLIIVKVLKSKSKVKNDNEEVKDEEQNKEESVEMKENEQK